MILAVLRTWITVSAVNSWRRALRRDCRLPSSLLGPVPLRAFLRLASICRNEVIGRRILAPGRVHCGYSRRVGLWQVVAAAGWCAAAAGARRSPILGPAHHPAGTAGGSFDHYVGAEQDQWQIDDVVGISIIDFLAELP
jgi:hypothetical protein